METYGLPLLKRKHFLAENLLNCESQVKREPRSREAMPGLPVATLEQAALP